MKLSRSYDRINFKPQTIRHAAATIAGMPRGRESSSRWGSLSIKRGQDDWTYDDPEEFFSEMVGARNAAVYFAVTVEEPKTEYALWYHQYSNGSSISFEANERNQVLRVMNIFDTAIADDGAIKIEPPEPNEEERALRIFVGHGRSTAWRDLKDHLSDKHRLNILAYESGERSGHTIRDVLEEMLDESSLAFLIFTGEDETVENHFRARQNVVHECGLFQGRLGFSRAIVLLEEGVEEFSNLAGTQYISFPKGHIKSTFGDVLAVINRETSLRTKI